MQLMKYSEIIALTKELKDKALAPVRVQQAKIRFDAKIAELEEKKINAESKIQELCSVHPIDVDKLIDAIDDVALVDRRIAKVKEVQEQLFG